MEDYTMILVEDAQIQHLEFECHYEAYSDDEDGSWAGDVVDVLKVFLCFRGERVDVTEVVTSSADFRDMVRDWVIESKGY
jgi:hypothetical protein